MTHVTLGPYTVERIVDDHEWHIELTTTEDDVASVLNIYPASVARSVEIIRRSSHDPDCPNADLELLLADTIEDLAVEPDLCRRCQHRFAAFGDWCATCSDAGDGAA